MSDWECVRNNPQTGVSTWIKREPDGILVQTRQDMSALLDANVAEQNVASNNWNGDYHRVARLPSEMLYSSDSYIGDAIRADDDTAVRRFLNDSEHTKLRTKAGKL